MAARMACPVVLIRPHLRLDRCFPDPTERGFKDTVKANPGQSTIIRAKFDLPRCDSAP